MLLINRLKDFWRYIKFNFLVFINQKHTPRRDRNIEEWFYIIFIGVMIFPVLYYILSGLISE